MCIPRINQDHIIDSFSRSFITALIGARRVGKSYFIQQYIQHNNDKLFVQFNMDRLKEREDILKQNLKSLIQEQAEQRINYGRKIWVIIDEAQKLPQLFDQIKLLYDEYKDQDALKFILTGSASLSLHQLSAETLAGRIEIVHLREFSLRESALLRYKNLSLPKENFFDVLYRGDTNVLSEYAEEFAPYKIKLTAELKEQIVWGGLPEVIKLNEEKHRQNYLHNYLQTYFEKDIRAISNISDLNLFRHLMNIVAEQTGSIKQIDKILQALGCARETLKKYLGYLNATMMYQEIYPYIGIAIKRIVKSPKIYLENNGLISLLTNIKKIELLSASGLIGHRFENWFLKELQISLDRNSDLGQIYYWRTSSGVEVDFIVDFKSKVIPFEVTYSTQIQRKKVSNLLRFMIDEKKAEAGYYIYTGEYRHDKEKNIHFIPYWMIG